MKKTKNVLHVIAGMNRGGAETLLMNIFRNIDRSKYRFFFLVHNEEEGIFDKEILELGGVIFRVENPKKNLRNYKKELNKILINEKIDVIHSHMYSFSGIILNVAKKVGTPVRIAHSHNTQDGYSTNLKRIVYRNLTKRLINKNATDLLGCSRDACYSLFGKTPDNDSRVKVIKNGIDISLYKSLKKVESKRNIINELKLSENATIIGHVGSFTRQKNHTKIIEIFQEYLNINNDAYLVLVGDGPLKNEIENETLNRGLSDKVFFLGIRNDIPNLMSGFDLFLFPSLFEGLGIVLIEAQAAGTICLVSDNIPKEADLNIGLLNTMNIDDYPIEWANKIDLVLNNKVELDKGSVIGALSNEGYNIQSTIKELTSIYNY